MGESYSAIGNLEYHEGSDNESFSSFSKRHQEPPKEATPLNFMDEDMRSSYHAFQMFCTTRFGWLMCFLWVLSFCCAIISAVLYHIYTVTIWQNSNILCIDSLRAIGMISGVGLTFILVLGLIGWIIELGCGRSRSRESFANCMLLFFVCCLLGPILSTIAYNIAGTPMLIKSSDNIIYDCEFDEGDMDAHLILAWPDQN